MFTEFIRFMVGKEEKNEERLTLYYPWIYSKNMYWVTTNNYAIIVGWMPATIWQFDNLSIYISRKNGVWAVMYNAGGMCSICLGFGVPLVIKVFLGIIPVPLVDASSA
jgi:hypothetical protein